MSKIKHMVMFRFGERTPAGVIDGVFADLEALKRELPAMLDFSWGTNVSVEGLSQNFTHGMVMTFANASARDTYLYHPLHEALKAKVVPHLAGGLAGALVFDYEC